MKPTFYLIFSLIVLLPVFVLAQGSVYAPLVDLSNAGQGNDVQTFEQYINFLYGMSIAVAALLAVIKIVIAGAKYMLSDVISNKSEALKDIQGAILGLLLILSAVVILELINPQLTEKDIVFKELPTLDPSLLRERSLSVADASANLETEMDNKLNVGCGTLTKSNTEQYFARGFNASTCSDPGAALGAFNRACMGMGGKVFGGRAAELITGCSIPKTGVGVGGRSIVEGAKDAADLADQIATSFLINSQRQVGREFVTQTGSLVAVNATGACNAQVNTLPEETRRGQFEVCERSLISSVSSRCSSAYGKFNDDNISAVTCQIPKRKQAVTELTTAFSAYKAASASRQYHTIDNLSAAEERELCEKFAKGSYFDEWGSENTCVFY